MCVEHALPVAKLRLQGSDTAVGWVEVTLAHPGVVDYHVHGSETVDRSVVHPLDVRVDGDVHHLRQHVGLVCKLLDERLVVGRVTARRPGQVGGDDLCALCQEATDVLAAHASRRAGDQDHFACQTHRFTSSYALLAEYAPW